MSLTNDEIHLIRSALKTQRVVLLNMLDDPMEHIRESAQRDIDAQTPLMRKLQAIEEGNDQTLEFVTLVEQAEE